MAGIKIVDLPALGRDLISTDLLEVSLNGSGSRKITGQEIMNASKLAVGSTPIVSGTVGRLLFQNTGDVLGQSANLFWDNTNGRLGIGTSSPLYTLDVAGNIHGNGIFAEYNIVTTAGNVWLSDGYAIGDYGTGNNRIEFYNNRISLFGNGNEAMRIVGSTQNVLIGTTTDAGFKLDVNGTARVSGLLTLNNNIEFSSYNRTIANSSFPLSAISTNQVRSLNDFYDSGGTNGFTFYNNGGTIRGRIYATGNWFIGSSPTDAGFRLDVNGTARVQTNLIVSATNPTAQIAGAASFSSRISGNLNGSISGQAIASVLVDESAYSGTGSSIIRYAVYAGSSYFDRLNVNVTSTTYASSNVINDTAAATLRLIGYNVLTGGSGSNNGTLLLTDRISGAMLGMTATYGGGGSRLTIFNQYTDGPTSRIKINMAGVDTACFFADGSLQIGNGETTIASAILSASSTTRGFLPPRMTNAQRAAIASPAVGLIVYCTDSTEGLYVYKSTGWTFMV